MQKIAEKKTLHIGPYFIVNWCHTLTLVNIIMVCYIATVVNCQSSIQMEWVPPTADKRNDPSSEPLVNTYWSGSGHSSHLPEYT